MDRAAAAWIFNALVRFKPGTIDPNTLEPDLAESWDESPDGKTGRSTCATACSSTATTAS